MSEVWKPIPGFVGRYEASSLGRIRSLPNKRRSTTLVMKLRKHKSGYLQVRLTSHDGTRWHQTLFWVARLVCLAFCGPCPPGMEACHGDGYGANNASANLRWDTPVNNQADRAIHGTANIGSQNPRSKLVEAQVKEIKRRLSDGEHAAAIAPDYSVAVRTIKAIKNGYNWGHVHV